MGIPAKVRTGESSTKGAPKSPSIPSAKEAQSGAPRGKGAQNGVKG